MKNTHLFISLTFLFLVSSCEKFLELEPETSLSSAVAFDNIEGVEAGLNGAYSIIHSDWVERQYVFAECFASNVREVNSLGNSNYQDALRHASWVDLFNTSNYLWRMSYQVIDLTNQALKALPLIEEPNQQIAKEKKRLTGEALFLRGLQYFVLNRFFAQPQNNLSIILQLEPFTPQDMPFRATIDEVKNQVLQDLRGAEVQMQGTNSNNGRATLWAVKALLARVYFEYKDYSTAAQYADDVINNGVVDGRRLSLLLDDLTPLYSASITAENIFTFLANPRDRANNRLFEIFSLSSSAVELSITDSFWEVIAGEPQDIRLQQLHEDFTVAHACHKYNDRDMNIPYIRLPEMYLIRAESRANMDQLDASLTDLNILRQRAGLEETTYQDKADLLNQIFIERSLELSMEGDNFHNLKRLERPIGGFSWDEAKFKLVFFLPEKEVQLNPNLIQNDIW